MQILRRTTRRTTRRTARRATIRTAGRTTSTKHEAIDIAQHTEIWRPHIPMQPPCGQITSCEQSANKWSSRRRSRAIMCNPSFVTRQLNDALARRSSLTATPIAVIKTDTSSLLYHDTFDGVINNLISHCLNDKAV